MSSSRVIYIRKAYLYLILKCRYLYPDPQRVLIKDVNQFEHLKDLVKGVEACKRVLGEVAVILNVFGHFNCQLFFWKDPSKKEDMNNQNLKSIDDIMYEEETKKYVECFDGQS